MRLRYLVGVLIVAAVGIALLRFAATTVRGQDAQAVNVVSAAPDVPLYSPFLPESAPPPRNADGHPDLNGVWDYATATPLQRPSEFGDSLFLTAEEAEALHQSRQWHMDEVICNQRLGGSDPCSNVEFDAYSLGLNKAWYTYDAALLQNRSSLIVDPPDGRIPPLTPAAEEQRARIPPRDQMKADHVKDRTFRERCLVLGNGPPFRPDAFNNNVHIFHTKDVVVIHTEMVHTARVIWLDGRPHHSPAVRQWTGDSRGRWEEDTLVIETTNFRPEVAAIDTGGVLDPEAFTLVERLTRIGEDTLMYEYTMNDPATWTRPWTAQLPMRRQDGMVYEYACHEGNYGLKFILSGARGMERQRAEAAK